MSYSSESLSRELDSLKAAFSGLSERLEQSAKQFRMAGVAVPEALLAEVAEFKRGVAELGEKIRQAGTELSVPKHLLADPRSATLDILERSLGTIAQAEEQCAVQAKALTILERICCLARRDRTIFPPLLECQSRARELRDNIMNFPGTGLHPAAKELAAGTHPASILLRLIENQDELSDDDWRRFSNAAAESFGSDLAVAATRSKLEVLSPSPAQVLPLQVPGQNSSAAAESGALGELDQAIEKFVTTHAWANKPTAAKALPEAAGSLPSVFGISPSGLATERASAQSVFSEVEAALVEMTELEELAERHSGQENYSEAEEAYQRLLTVQKKVFGPQDPKLAATTEKIGDMRRLQAERVSREAGFDRTIDTRKSESAPEYTPYIRPVNSAFRKPESENRYSARSVRAGLFALALLAIGLSIYGVVRYRGDSAAGRSQKQISTSNVAASPAARALPETRPVAEPREIGGLNAAPQETAPTASPQARSTAKAVSAATQQAAHAERREMPSSARQDREITQAAPIAKAPAKQLVEVPTPNPIIGVPVGTGTAGSSLNLVNSAAPPPPPPAAPQPERIRVGGLTTAPKLIREVNPAYPPLARQARIQGTVRLEGVIGTDGSVLNLRVVSGHPLLRDEAIRAVKQWRYQPGLLNGVPAAVTTTMEVNFLLGN